MIDIEVCEEPLQIEVKLINTCGHMNTVYFTKRTLQHDYPRLCNVTMCREYITPVNKLILETNSRINYYKKAVL